MNTDVEQLTRGFWRLTQEQQRYVLTARRKTAEVDAPPRARLSTRPGPAAPRAPAETCSRIGDHRPIAKYAKLFETHTWRKAWRPGIQLHLYLLGNPNLAAMAASIDEALAKIGTAEIGKFDRRRQDLDVQRYGDTVRLPTGYHREADWGRFVAFPKLQLGPQPALCPIRGSTASLILTLPVGWTPQKGEACVNRILMPYRLQTFADSDSGRRVCATRGVSPETLVRYSTSGAGVEAATEFTLIRAQADASRLAAIMVKMIARDVRSKSQDPLHEDWDILDDEKL